MTTGKSQHFMVRKAEEPFGFHESNYQLCRPLWRQQWWQLCLQIVMKLAANKAAMSSQHVPRELLCARP
jgi:hypothetical protein